MKGKSLLIRMRRNGFFNWIPDELYLKWRYRRLFKRKLDLENPITFNEKMQWLKLYDRNPLYTQLVDKYEVKKYISEKVGKEYTLKTLGLWDSFEEIDFSKLPEQFVLKCTHDSGTVIICKDRKTFNVEEAKKKIEYSLKRNFFWEAREWPYKNVKPRIIAEEYLAGPDNTEVRDYKFLCLNGEAKFLLISSKDKKSGDRRVDLFDLEENVIKIDRSLTDYSDLPSFPIHFDKMKELSSYIAKDFPTIRVDFYESKVRIYIGELTFYNCGGFACTMDYEWDKILGEMLTIDPKTKKGAT